MNLMYCLMVTGPGFGNQKSNHALQFAKTVINCGHYLHTVFFYRDGVYNANCFSLCSSDEFNLVNAWYNLTKYGKINLYVCITSAMRRGIINMEQSVLLGINGNNMHSSFKLTGLGSLAESILICDRFIQF